MSDSSTLSSAHSGSSASVPSDPPPGGPPEGNTKIPVNWRVLVASGVLIIAFSAWAMLAPAQADTVIGGVVAWVAKYLGWFYILTATLIIVFVVIVAASKQGNIKMGPGHAKPQFNMFTWTAMLFAAGIGVDLMFFSVSEPVSQYYAPPVGEGQNLEAARQAVVWTLFHYGITGWAMYADRKSVV